MSDIPYSRYGWVIVGAAWLTVVSINATSFSIAPITNLVKDDFAVSYADVGLLFSIPTLIFVLFSVPGGIMADRIGVRKAGGIGAIIMGVSSVLRASSPSFAALLLFTLIFAIGYGIAFPSLPKIVSEWFPKRLLGTASGIYAMGFPLGATATLALTLPLHFFLGGWRNALLVWGFLALVTAAFWWAFVKANPARTSQASSQPRSSYLPRGVWRNRNLWTAAIILFMSTVIFFVEASWLPVFFTERGLDPTLAAIMVSTLTLGNLAGTSLIPFSSDRMGLRKPLLLGFSILSAIAAYALLTSPLSYGWFLLPLLGICVAAAFSFSFILPVELSKTTAVGSAIGMVFSVGFSGGFVGPYIIGYFRDLTGNFGLLPWVIVIASLAIAFLTLVLPETGRRKRALRGRETVLLKRFTEMEKLFHQYQQQLHAVLKDWEHSKAELTRELEVLNKSINDSREALHELEVLHELGEIPSNEFIRRKKELEEAVRYLNDQASFIKTSIERTETFMTHQRLELKPSIQPSSTYSLGLIPREAKMIEEKLAKLEDMHKTGKVKEELYRKLKTEYERKLSRLRPGPTNN